MLEPKTYKYLILHGNLPYSGIFIKDCLTSFERAIFFKALMGQKMKPQSDSGNFKRFNNCKEIRQGGPVSGSAEDSGFPFSWG
jgi:hypothetical protein